MIFRFDVFNRTNFHEYIDRIPNIMLVIALENGRKIAAFTSAPFVDKGESAEGMIIVLNT